MTDNEYQRIGEKDVERIMDKLTKSNIPTKHKIIITSALDDLCEAYKKLEWESSKVFTEILCDYGRNMLSVIGQIDKDPKYNE